jgi:hypothetical protein
VIGIGIGIVCGEPNPDDDDDDDDDADDVVDVVECVSSTGFWCGPRDEEQQQYEQHHGACAREPRAAPARHAPDDRGGFGGE